CQMFAITEDYRRMHCQEIGANLRANVENPACQDGAQSSLRCHSLGGYYRTGDCVFTSNEREIEAIASLACRSVAACLEVLEKAPRSPRFQLPPTLQKTVDELVAAARDRRAGSSSG